MHTFDHTLPTDVQDYVASTPGLNFHPIGIGSTAKGTGESPALTPCCTMFMVWQLHCHWLNPAKITKLLVFVTSSNQVVHEDFN